MGWGNVLKAAVDGGLAGYNMAKGWENSEKDKAWIEEGRNRQRSEWADKDAEKTALKSAGAERTVMATADDTSGVSALMNGGKTDGFSVAGQSYADRGSADAAAATMNAPEAVAARTAQAYRGLGDPGKAMAMETGARQAEAATMELADKKWKRDLGAAVAVPGFDGLAKFAERSEVGPMKGMKGVQALTSEDGTEVRFASAADDGSLQYIPNLPTFKNTNEDKIRAAWMLDKTVSMSDRMTHMDQQAQRQEQRDDRQHNYARQDRQDARQESQFSQTLAIQQGTAERQNRLADQTIKTSELAYTKALEENKVPAAVSSQIKFYQSEAADIAKSMREGLSKGTMTMDSPAYAELQTQSVMTQRKLSATMSPYLPKAKEGTPVANADPAGVTGGASAGPADGATPGKAPNSYQAPEWDGYEQQAAKAVGLPPELLQLIKVIRTKGERSNGDQVSGKSARGVYQFIPDTQKAVKSKYGFDAYSKDPQEQANAAAALIKEIYERNGRNIAKTAAGYNGGISGEKGTNRTKENKDYIARVTNGMNYQEADPLVAQANRNADEIRWDKALKRNGQFVAANN